MEPVGVWGVGSRGDNVSGSRTGFKAPEELGQLTSQPALAIRD